MREAVRLYIRTLGEAFKNDYMSLIFVASPKLLEKDLRSAYERDVDIKIVAFGEIKTNIALVYSHEGGT